MAIEVRCQNGHLLRVKDKYAGKRGWCPHCRGVVLVPLAPTFSEDDVLELLETQSASPASDAQLVQEPTEAPVSLLGGSFIRQKKHCPQCHASVPLWFASCPSCKYGFEDL